MVLWLRILILAAVSYAFGNWSMARMIAWNTNHTKISTQGSGNPGTMNMVRRYGYKKGILTLILDAAKGAIPALLGGLLLELGLHEGEMFHYSVLGVYIGGLAVIIGHMLPVAFKFRGGKGVACGIGVFLVADPVVALIAFIIAFTVFVVFEYGFIASLSLIVIVTAVQYIRLSVGIGLLTQITTDYLLAVEILIGVIFALVIIAHRRNFIRLFTGKESKISTTDAIRKYRAKKRGEQVQSKNEAAVEDAQVSDVKSAGETIIEKESGD